jgi:LysR family transcriptional regulator, glycine cleavage system transcriptional activator
MSHPRQRPLAIGPLRAFEAVARLSSFRGAAEELHLTQPAISRQIRSLEDEIGTPLFTRGTRHVALTLAGATLRRTLDPLLVQLDSTVQQLRQQGRRQPVGLTTFASFASLWLLPRLHGFQDLHPGIDIRVSATDRLADLDDPELDLGLRYGLPDSLPAGSERLFGELLTPVASPALLARAPIRRATDLARHVLLEEDDGRPSAQYVSWRNYLRQHAPSMAEPKSWIYLNYTYQQVQAALAGQGVALARVALVVESLARGELVEPLGPAGRLRSPYAYWLVRWPGRHDRPGVAAVEAWLLEQAAATRAAVGEAEGHPDGQGEGHSVVQSVVQSAVPRATRSRPMR